MTDDRNEHTIYAHGRRILTESDASVARRVARENIGGHARNVRAVYSVGDVVLVAAEVETLTRSDRTRIAMVRDQSGELAVIVLSPEVAP